MKKVIAAAFYYGTLAMLAYSILVDSPQLQRVSVVNAWFVILILLVVCLVTFGHNLNLTDLMKPDRHAAAREFLLTVTKRHGFLKRGWNLICSVAFIFLLAYSGWVFTAVCYIAVNISIWLSVSVARDTLAKTGEMQA